MLDIRYFIGSIGFFTLASRALTVVIGFQIYQITHSALSLGLLGLVEAVPAISLVLVGGYAADHFNRRRILLITRTASCLCALGLAFLSSGHQTSLPGLYTVIFFAGIARGFADPANTAFEAQVVPQHLAVKASSWIGSAWIGCLIIGPAVIGFVFDAFGAIISYSVIGAWFAASLICTLAISPKPQFMPKNKEPLFKSIRLGWRFVLGNQALSGAMALDLFAVLFGGAIALLPIYATDILRVGAKGLGLLNAAPSLGALAIMVWAGHQAPRIMTRAGRNLLWAVGGFGISMLVFAFSKNFWLSMAALMLSGIFDGVSMIIRRSMVRLLSPDDMRGRIAAVNWVFICASNELGAFESGMVAAWIGALPCVAAGGLVTLAIVGLTATLAPALRRLRFDPHTLEQKI
ncbi:MAG: MFS transporter [Candidatus Omnitrophica bacterium]|nr:MFS transporter [Candidatus Omnitrophota bacterium]